MKKIITLFTMVAFAFVIFYSGSIAEAAVVSPFQSETVLLENGNYLETGNDFK